MARPGAHRKFYDFSGQETEREGEVLTAGGGKNTKPEELVKYVSKNIIGSDAVFSSPFGPRQVVYCDYTASGRSLAFIEDYIRREVLPQYGSTHTTATVTALQTTLFRHEARDIIRNATQASEHDRVMFVGTGATGVLHKLIHGLALDSPPVVLVCPYAHHSSLLPWRELGAKVIRIRETSDGSVDMQHLEETLAQHRGGSGSGSGGRRRRVIGCFSAASNVTGTVVDDVAVTRLLHRYSALAFWDYATAAPYVPMRMNPTVPGDTHGHAHKDAMFFSMHKFVGGVQTPGVLVAKESLFCRRDPEVCGGGSVFFVSRDSHRYLQDVETREEGGTPAIVEAVRAGLVMQLTTTITPSFIAKCNNHLARVLERLGGSVDELEALGNLSSPDRLPILSFVVRHPPSGLLLHHNFVCAVLNDLYGIQARGGCACAGPYAQDLLGLSEPLAQRYEALLLEDPRLDRSHLRRRQEHSDLEVLRPGFVRLNLSYTATPEQVEFIVSALSEVCRNAWRLLPQYSLNPVTGEWKHHTNLVFRGRQWLGDISYRGGTFTYPGKNLQSNQQEPLPDYAQCLEKAEEVFRQAAKVSQRRQIPDDTILFQEEAASLRWFLLPSEAKTILSGAHLTDNTCPQPPFTPVRYPLSPDELRSRPDFVWEERIENWMHRRPRDVGDRVEREEETQGRDGTEREDQRPSTDVIENREWRRPERDVEVKRRVLRLERDGEDEGDQKTRTDEEQEMENREHRPQRNDEAERIELNLKRDREEGSDCNNKGKEGDQIRPSSTNEEEKAESTVQRQGKSDEVEKRELKLRTNGEETPKSDVNKFENLHSSSEMKNENEEKRQEHQTMITVNINTGHERENEREGKTEGISQGEEQEHQTMSSVNINTGHEREGKTEGVSQGEEQEHQTMSSVDINTRSDHENVSKKQTQSVNEEKTQKHHSEYSEHLNTKSNQENESEGKSQRVSEEETQYQSSQQHFTSTLITNGQECGGTTGLGGEGEKEEEELVCEGLKCFVKRKVTDASPNQESVTETITPSAKWHPPPKNIFNPTLEALTEFDMIRDGDSVMVCLSGGKDSLSLLHTLRQYQFYARARNVTFTLSAATVDPMSAAYDPRPLIPYLGSLGVPYFFEQQDILGQAAEQQNLNSICSFCSRMKRGRLYAAARRNKCNVLAFGQHLDDLAESFMMSIFHNGRLRTMKAHYTVKENDLRVIRPFVYVREKDLRKFAESQKLPVIPENCPACFEAPKERQRVKQVLAQQEVLFPSLYWSLRSALHPVMAISQTGVESTMFGKNGVVVTSEKGKALPRRHVEDDDDDDT